MIPQTLPKSTFAIYLIIGPNGKIYVGKTKSPYHRCYQYIRAVRKQLNNHINNHLLNAFLKYGIDSFTMICWEICHNEFHVSERELFWIDYFNSTDRNKGYNIRRDSKTGMITHPETSDKISNNLRKQWDSGIRNDHSHKLKLAWERTPERRNVQSNIMRKNLTRYSYRIYTNESHFDCNYQLLVSIGFKNAICEFHRKKSNKIQCKGYTIERMTNG